MATREEIKEKVIEVLKTYTDEEEISEGDQLFRDLGMTANAKKALAGFYTDISTEYGGNPISQSKAGELSTVKETIDLVLEKSNANENEDD